jgi:hypothetical protein
MKFSKILLIFAILALVSAFAMNVSFAAGENLALNKSSQIVTYDKKVSTIDAKYLYNNKKENVYLNVKVKKDYQKKYKIKSVKVKYDFFNKKGVYQKTAYKTYNGENKKSILIKIPNYSSTNKIAITYNTKSKLKKESVNFFMKSNSKKNIYLQSKKSKANIVEKGYNKISGKEIIYVPTYQKITIQTKNKNYKIKLIRFVAYNTSSGEKQNIDVIPENVNKYVLVNYEFSTDLGLSKISLYYY